MPAKTAFGLFFFLGKLLFCDLLHENTEALWFFGILLWYQPVFPALLPEKYAMAKRKKK